MGLTPSEQTNNCKHGEANHEVNPKTRIDLENVMAQVLRQTRLNQQEINDIPGKNGKQRFTPEGAIHVD